MADVLTGREKPKTKTVIYRGPEELVHRLERAAKKKNLSRNEAMTQLLEFALKHESGGEKSPRRK